MKTTRNNIIKKLTAATMAAMMMSAVIPAAAQSLAVTAYAQESTITYADIQSKILYLKNYGGFPFETGSQWYGSYGSKVISVYDENGNYKWFWKSTGWQCYGFAKKAFDEVFKDYSNRATYIRYSGSGTVSDKLSWLKNNVHIGDYVRYGGHSVLVYDVTDNYMTVYDNNHGGDCKTYFENIGWSSYSYCNGGASTVKDQLKYEETPNIVRSTAAVAGGTTGGEIEDPRRDSYTSYVYGTDGSLVINSRASAGYGLAEIPEYAACTVYPHLSQGNWYYVSYNGVEGYSYCKYLKTDEPSYKWGYIRNTDGSLCINRTPSTRYCIAEIPEGAWCKVYTQRRSGNWVWVEYNGVFGYSYRTYISY